MSQQLPLFSKPMPTNSMAQPVTRATAKWMLVAALTAGCAAPTLAASLTLGYSQTYNGSTNVLAGAGAINVLNATSSSSYEHTFSAPTSIIPATVGLNASVPGGFGFYDDFLFTISSAAANSITSTIGLSNILGINDLQVRLYSAAQSAPLPILGTPSGTVLEGWTTLIAPGSSVSIIPSSTLNAGTYVLEVRGNVVGSSGASYSGVLNVNAVPVPSAVWLFGSACGALVSLRRRAHTAA